MSNLQLQIQTKKGEKLIESSSLYRTLVKSGKCKLIPKSNLEFILEKKCFNFVFKY